MELAGLGTVDHQDHLGLRVPPEILEILHQQYAEFSPVVLVETLEMQGLVDRADLVDLVVAEVDKGKIILLRDMEEPEEMAQAVVDQERLALHLILLEQDPEVMAAAVQALQILEVLVILEIVLIALHFLETVLVGLRLEFVFLV